MYINPENILKKFKGDQKINYDKVLQEMIKVWEIDPIRPKVLIHSCCAPCSTYTLEYLSKYCDITIYFANSNIHPQSEYERRLYEQKVFINKFNETTNNNIGFIGEKYNPLEYYQRMKGLEMEKEGGARCKACFAYRLDLAAEKAQELKYDYFGSALTLSPMKNSQVINVLGLEVQSLYSVQYLPSDFKKNNGYKRSVEMCEEYDVYRQCYCGCIFALQQQGLNPKEIDKAAKGYMKDKDVNVVVKDNRVEKDVI